MVTTSLEQQMVKKRMFEWKLLLLSILFIGNILPALSQRLREQRTSGGIGFMEFLPPDYNNGNKKHPLMIFLHGIGERGNGTTDLRRVVTRGTPIGLADSGNDMTFMVNGQTFSFIVLAPQLLSQYGSWPAWYVDQVVEHAKATYRVDESRIYVTGLSLGGGGTWDYVAAYPQKVAAMVAVCGASGANTTKVNALATNNIPIWATHGTADNVVRVGTTQNWINSLNNHPTPPNPRPRLTLYEGAGHNIWGMTYSLNPAVVDPVVKDMHVYEWMLRHSKDRITANAGQDMKLKAPVNSVQLRGSVSVQGTQLSTVQWTQVAGSPAVAIQQANTLTPTLLNVPVGTFTFRLTVTGTNGKTSSDEVVVRVERTNLLPVANPGPNRSVTLPALQITLDGSQSYDPDGTITAFRWEQINIGTHPEAVLVNFTGNSQQGAPWNNTRSATSNGTVINNLLSRNGQASPINITLQSSWGGYNEFGATANNAGILPDNVMRSCFWFETGTHPLQVRGLRAGTTYRFGFFASRAGSGDRNTRYTIGNQSVVLNASNNTSQLVWLNNIQPNSNGEVQIVVEKLSSALFGYLGALVIEPALQVQGNLTPVLTLSNLVPGTFRYRLTVTDNDGATNAREVEVVVAGTNHQNRPPVVSAGTNRSITLPTNSTTLTGTASDPDGTIATTRWTQVSGPNTATIASNTALSTTVSGLVQGTYVFRLTATDNAGATASADVSVTVNPAPNRPPVVSAGTNRSITLPTNSTTLTGTASDPDGTVASTRWTQVSGPNTATIASNTALSTTVSGLVQGTYVFRLTATDNAGATANADVTITVNPAPNRSPVVSAGKNRTINTNNVVLGGTVSDPDNNITSILWVQVSGPSGAVITTPNREETTVTGLTRGEYVFRLSATDAGGLSASATVTITVDIVMAANPDDPTRLRDKRYIQKVLSPNNDGIGDIWVINEEGELSVTVFDRMGKIVYHADSYNNDWDGVSKDGVPLPSGTYFYTIRAKRSSKVINGALNIVR
ncbi:PKD domain-containing protein [Rhodoflexus sp.]